ncbi:MAG: WecB/TagA/CpsF family glycosyltransferase [Clostridiales bacterium]|nr:WecB/TagA/CpsF family glycosyltransferase [Clostridiales bacterium]
MNGRIDVLGIGFDNLTPGEALEHADRCIKARSGGYVVTPNPEMVWRCRTDFELSGAIGGAELVLSDGIGIIYGAKILRTPLKGRVTGIGFAESLTRRLAARGGSVYLFGAKPGVAKKAGENLTARYPGIVIAGTADGYFKDDEAVIEDINKKRPDFLMVCLGFPKQEIWARDNRAKLDVGVIACLGGSLDVMAGVVDRAPERWQKLGLEWLYRLIRQPSRLGRMMSLPKFLFATILSRFGKEKNG